MGNKRPKWQWALLCVLPYIAWLVYQEPRSAGEIIILCLIAVCLPIWIHRWLKARFKASITAMIVTPLVVVLLVYLDCRASGESWFDVIYIVALVATAPIWVLSSILGGMNNGVSFYRIASPKR